MNIFNKKGLTIVECVVAMLLTSVAVVSLMTMQSVAWRGAATSDYRGRANGLLQRELDLHENDIMRGTAVASGTTCADKDGNVVTCGNAGTMFTLTNTITPPSGTTITWLVNVRITWVGGSVNGIGSSMIVSRQTAFN
jgi:Tfp pilus assembly protein PilV